MQLIKAYKIADRIVAALAPMCSRIEVAGSIRRARAEVGDIDLVVLPLPSEEQHIRSRILANTTLVSDGPQTLIVRLTNGLQLDTWFAHELIPDLIAPQPSNWGTLLLCRTGSRHHNMYVAQRATELGLHWDPHHGVKDGSGRIVASAEEREVLDAVGLAWVPPALRER